MTQNSRQRFLRIYEMMRKTDEAHPLNTSQIVQKLQTMAGDTDIGVGRNTIANDLKCLENEGYEIVKCENHNLGWYMVEHDFEDHELKMLVDAVASAKFLTEEDSRKLIRKIKKLATIEGERLIDATLIMDPELKIVDKKWVIHFSRGNDTT